MLRKVKSLFFRLFSRTETAYVLLIHHRHGENISAHRTERGAFQALFEYCDENWDREVLDKNGNPNKKPLKQRDLVQLYFQAVEEEYSSIESVQIQD